MGTDLFYPGIAMKHSNANTNARYRKIQKVLDGALPFLVAAGLINSQQQRQELKRVTVVLGHKTVLLPGEKIKSTRHLRRGQRYVLLKAGEPMATVDLPPMPKGKRKQYHVTYGPSVEPLFKTLQWLTTTYRVPEMKITVLMAVHLGKNFAYDERKKRTEIYEVAAETPPTSGLITDVVRMHNQMVVFLEKEHRKFKKALAIKLKQVSAADASTA
jgi:hypothetical protein